MKRLKDIPKADFQKHDGAGTLGDSDFVTEISNNLTSKDDQLQPEGS